MVKKDEHNGITLTRGDTAVFKIALEDGNGNPYDYSGDTVKFGVKRSAFDTDCVLEKPVNENGEVVLDPADTASMDFGDYLYSVRLYHSSGESDTDVYTPIASARFSLGFDIIKQITA